MQTVPKQGIVFFFFFTAVLRDDGHLTQNGLGAIVVFDI
jgi:hypothetical protein